MMFEPSTCNVFVYGTLKPGEANYLSYCNGKVVSQIPVYTRGELYALPLGYPAMTSGTSKVYGVCLTFADSKVLDSLDRLEDYQERRVAELNEYYRSLTSTYDLENRFVARAWAYYMTRDRVLQYRGVKVTSGFWTGTLAANSKDL